MTNLQIIPAFRGLVKEENIGEFPAKLEENDK